MAIISQETWNNIPKEEKEKILVDYTEFNRLSEDGIDEEERIINANLKWQMEKYFGKENLQPEPKIRTLKDLEIIAPSLLDFKIETPIGSFYDKLHDNLVASYKIGILIEFGYGGNITDEEWETVNKSKWVINCDISKEDNFEILELFVDKFFIAFHEKSQAEEFMSYEENRELLRQYYML